MYEFLHRGLDQLSERICLAACVGTLILHLLTIVTLTHLGVRIDDTFFARRTAFNQQHLQQLQQVVPSRLEMSRPVTVSNVGQATPSILLFRGWSAFEKWGIWTDGPQAEFAVALPEYQGKPPALELSANILIPDGGSQEIGFMAGKEAIGIWRIRSHEALLCVPVPASAVAKSGLVRLAISIRFPSHPPGGSDERDLGLGLKWIKVVPTMAHCEAAAMRPS